MLIAIADLKPSKQNARTYDTDEIEALMASIEAKGLIVPLMVRKNGKGYEILDGRRRYEAIKALIKAKRCDADFKVPTVVRDDNDTDALETSLIANIVRLPMHPVEQYEVFARLEKEGRSNADIAARFGLIEIEVKRGLALGRIAEPIRKAWKAGDISSAIAQEFTLCPDHKRQVAAFHELRRQNSLWPGQVRNMLIPKRVDVRSSAFRFVGRKAYEAAGGKVVEDLFGDDSFVEDPDIIYKLGREKLDAAAAKYTKEGWGWVEFAEDLSGQHYSWRAVEKNPSKEIKAKAGVVIGVGHDGSLTISRLYKPKDAKAVAKASAGPRSDDAGVVVSQALTERLSKQNTKAAAAVLKYQPRIALAVLLASLEAYGPTKISITQTAGNDQYTGSKITDRRTFDVTLAKWLEATVEQMNEQLALHVAGALDLTRFNGARNDTIDALVEALPSSYVAAAVVAFDATDYFNSVNSATCQAMVDECVKVIGKTAEVKPNLKKVDLAQHCIGLAKRTGWLPEILRHSAYKLSKGNAA